MLERNGNVDRLDCCPGVELEEVEAVRAVGSAEGVEVVRCDVWEKGGEGGVAVAESLLGLLKTGKRVELVTDAVSSLDESAAKQMMSEFTAAGGVLTTVAEVTGV